MQSLTIVFTALYSRLLIVPGQVEKVSKEVSKNESITSHKTTIIDTGKCGMSANETTLHPGYNL